MKKLLFISLSSFVIVKSSAQVEDVSVIFTPTLGYNWFDKKSTVENGTMFGFQAGFGFGRHIELRGTYERSINMMQNFGEYERDIQQYFPGFNFTDRKINITRVGGEFKANIPSNGFAPYLILGTGIQTFERENAPSNVEKNQNLYGTGGLGFKINMGNRVTLNLEGRGIVYNMNPGSLLYNPGGTSDFDDWVNNQDRSTMYNWSVSAGLQFYFGGRNEGELSNMDKAYLDRFSSGFSGVRLTLVPAGSYVDFSTKSAYRNTYMLGGQLGLDITDFIGIRGYYYQATENENPSFNFDKMAMYGVDFLGKLNVPRGIVPFISVGGGYINVQDGYRGKTLAPGIYQAAHSKYYAKLGAGLEVPLSTYVDIYGGANLMYTIDNRNTSVTDLRTADELNQHILYSVGLRLKIGRNANTARQTEKAFENRFSGERNEYNQKIKSLEKELKEAYENNDSEKAAQIIEEKKRLEKQATDKNNLIRLTPAELESLIDKVIQDVENESTPNIESRLERLEQLLLNLNQNRAMAPTAPPAANNYDPGYNNVNDRLLLEINKLNQQLEAQKQSIETLRQQNNNAQGNPVIVNPVTPAPVVPVPATPSNQPVTGGVINKGIGLFAGANFGDATTFNVGIRAHYGFTNSPFIFMPEGYVALGDKNGFGISANGIIPIRINNTNFEPYAGLGLGLHYLGKDFTFNTNVIGGVAYRLGTSSVFADYSVRGLFRNNQIVVGYRFGF
ncbi:MAG: hypothetical protein BGO09_06305 [Bacteroidetes bacterium 47-18]|nr:MAG: hypothetical protein BGO09_06305 [Bacteroidetes bacterium 47-18]